MKQARTQQGATLFTALIFLIMLSLLGLNAAQMGGLEEKMAGNARDRDLAFQAAQAGLVYVAANLSTIGAQIATPGSMDSGPGSSGNGLQAINICYPNSADYWNGNGAKDCTGTTRSYTWNTSHASYPDANVFQQLNQVAAQPMYVVEKMTPAPNGQSRYRVTVRGEGGNASTVVILQAMFAV